MKQFFFKLGIALSTILGIALVLMGIKRYNDYKKEINEKQNKLNDSIKKDLDTIKEQDIKQEVEKVKIQELNNKEKEILGSLHTEERAPDKIISELKNIQ